MKLYECPRKVWVKVVDPDLLHRQGPPSSANFSENQYIFFDHVDGMYSYCNDIYGNIVHLKAWCEVEIVDKHSEIFDSLIQIKRSAQR